MLVSDFADNIYRTPAAVTERLRDGKPYDAILSFKKVGNTYDLEVDIAKMKALGRRNKKSSKWKRTSDLKASSKKKL